MHTSTSGSDSQVDPTLSGVSSAPPTSVRPCLQPVTLFSSARPCMHTSSSSDMQVVTTAPGGRSDTTARPGMQVDTHNPTMQWTTTIPHVRPDIQPPARLDMQAASSSSSPLVPINIGLPTSSVSLTAVAQHADPAFHKFFSAMNVVSQPRQRLLGIST